MSLYRKGRILGNIVEAGLAMGHSAGMRRECRENQATLAEYADALTLLQNIEKMLGTEERIVWLTEINARLSRFTEMDIMSMLSKLTGQPMPKDGESLSDFELCGFRVARAIQRLQTDIEAEVDITDARVMAPLRDLLR